MFYFFYRPTEKNETTKHTNKNQLTNEEKWDLTKHLPKTLLAECTVEIHHTPLNR